MRDQRAPGSCPAQRSATPMTEQDLLHRELKSDRGPATGCRLPGLRPRPRRRSPSGCATSRRPGFCTTPNSTGPVACGRTSMPDRQQHRGPRLTLPMKQRAGRPNPLASASVQTTRCIGAASACAPMCKPRGDYTLQASPWHDRCRLMLKLPAPGALLLQEGPGAGEVALAQAIMRPSPTRPRTVFRPEGRVFAWPLMSTRSHVPSPLPSGIDFSRNSPTERQITDLPEAACVLSALVRRGCLGVYGIGIATPVRRIVNASRG